MAVGKGAAGGSSANESFRNGLEIVLSGTSSKQSLCLATITAGLLREIAAGGTRQARVEKFNVLSYSCMEPELVRQMPRLLQRSTRHGITPGDSRSSPPPSRLNRDGAIIEDAKPELGKRKRRAPQG